MNIDINVLKNDEKAIFTLRTLYQKYGYKQYKMSKFEEYDLYVRNKDFLVSDNIITFTDTDGKLMALKPDVTLSIIKNTDDTKTSVQKVYYNENVYRVSKGTESYKEIMQTGLECIGNIDNSNIYEVIMLACESLKSISEDYVLDISHMGIVTEVIESLGVSLSTEKQLLMCIGEKNFDEIRKICQIEGVDSEKLEKLISLYGDANKVLKELKEFIQSENTKQLETVVNELVKNGYGDKIRIDFSVINDMSYYNGFVFKGFINGISAGVLSGGQYDNLMHKMRKNSKAIGFAVYIDMLERIDDSENKETDNSEDIFINVALPKGRLGEKVYNMFKKAGFPCPSIEENNRKLIFENKEVNVRYFWVKPSDVAIYVERGAADIGVAGKDILLEYQPDVYELLDLDMGKCRMAVAAKKEFSDDTQKTLRVATKFTNITKKYYASLGREIDIIHLNGSIEIAPILGLSDVIVDIVETGTTLKENNLEVKEEIVPISARLISNKASFKFKNELIEKVFGELKKQTEDKND